MGDFLRKDHCPQCGSKDNLAVYTDGYYCHTPSCTYRSAGFIQEQTERVKKVTALKADGIFGSIPDRKLSKDVCQAMGIKIETNDKGVIHKHHYLYADKETGEVKSAKTRIVATKDMPWSGDRNNIGLFNQQNCKGHGRYITITEGEIDCASVYQMFNMKYDVVSLINGAKGAVKDIKDNLEFLEGYTNIVLCLDNDEPGRDAFDNIKDLFSPGKLQIVWLPSEYKDANAMLVAGEIKQFISKWWEMKSYSPVGIVECKDTWEEVLAYKNTPSVPYPWAGLNEMLLGQRTKEIVVWAADTGVGKSQTMREIQDNLIRTTSDNVGCLMLEESVGKTMMGWMSFMAEMPLHKMMEEMSDDALHKYWEMAVRDNRYILLDHRGWQNSLDTLKARLRHMVRVQGCKWVVLDHLHIALSSIAGASGDWSGIDELMTDLRGIVHELDIGLHLVSHTSGDRNLRGSKGIAKLADAVIFLERDKHHEDENIRNTTTVVVDKNRWGGDMGIACYLKYDPVSTRMIECPKPVASVSTEAEF